LLSSGLLGVMFALSFCPVSAALFFGSLVPLSVKHESYLIMPLFYGTGTGLPVMLFALAIAFGVKSVAQAFDKLTKVELWVRRGTGVIFILIGIYFCLRFIFGLFQKALWRTPLRVGRQTVHNRQLMFDGPNSGKERQKISAGAVGRAV